MFQVGPFVSLEVANEGFVFWTKRADWRQKSCYGNDTMGRHFFLVIDNYGAKFQEHCFKGEQKARTQFLESCFYEST